MWLQRVSSGGVEAITFAPDGRLMYTLDAGGGGTATTWDTTTRKGRQMFRLGHGPHRAAGLFVAGAGKFLVIRANPPIVWNLKEADEYARVAVGWPAALDLRPMPTNDNHLVFVPENRRSLVLWDLTARKTTLVHDWWVGIPPLRSFDIAPDGKTAALLDVFGLVVLIDLADRREITRFPCAYGTERVRFSPDGNTLAVFNGRQLRLRDVPSRSDRAEEVAIQPQYGGFAFHPKAQVFAAANPDRVLALWSLESGQQIRTFDFALARYVQCVAFSPDGKRCAAGGTNKQFIVFDVNLDGPPAPPQPSAPRLPGLGKPDAPPPPQGPPRYPGLARP
jgi:WD40 repeat protein